MHAGFELLEHGADYGIRGTGDTLEEAFQECAKAMFSILKNLDDIQGEKKLEIIVEADSTAELLVNWLNELLYQMHVKSWLFRDFKVKNIANRGIALQGKQWKIVAYAIGGKIDFKKEPIVIEIKGATYTGLKVTKEGKKFIAQCVVDV